MNLVYCYKTKKSSSAFSTENKEVGPLEKICGAGIEFLFSASLGSSPKARTALPKIVGGQPYLPNTVTNRTGLDRLRRKQFTVPHFKTASDRRQMHRQTSKMSLIIVNILN
ncbi:hypothetical protein QE152_g26667 [Popillia japonica]|uniref:Uncharacterized protein n=1 Tax=Popillia japonica TaxID=7064 RepID=A0AAW1JXN2_POPJA